MNRPSPYHANVSDDNNPYAAHHTVDAGIPGGKHPPAQADITPSVLAHVLAFCGYVIPFGHIVGPLIVYLIKKDDSPYARHHAAESLNFQISITIYLIIAAVLMFLLIGFLLLPILIIMDFILIIIAAVRASNGIWYRYPLSIRFIS